MSDVAVQHEKGSLRLEGDTLVVASRFMGKEQTRKHDVHRLKPVKVWREGDAVGIFVESGFGSQDKLTACSPIDDVVHLLIALQEVRPDLSFVTDRTDDLPWLLATLGIQFEASTKAARDDRRAATRTELEARFRARRDARDSKPRVEIKKYKGEREFQRDAERMVRDGWHIEGQSTRTKKYSLATGFFTNKGISTVTWIKGGSPEPDEKGEQVAAPATLASPPEDIPAKLEQIARLRDAGIISSEDFEAKKAELLGRL